MNYFDLASRILQEHQANTLKAIEEGNCVSCGKKADPSLFSLCPDCHREEMLMLVSMGREK